MKYRIFIILFFSTFVFVTSQVQINESNHFRFKHLSIKSTQLLNDTAYKHLVEIPILGFESQISSNPGFNSFMKKQGDKIIINFDNYHHHINESSHHSFNVRNNLFRYSIKNNNSVYSFGITHNLFAEFSLSKELVDLLVNGNYNYLNQTFSIDDQNYAHGYNFFSIYFGYSKNLSERTFLSSKFKLIKGISSVGLNIEQASFLFADNFNTYENPFSLDLDSEAVYFRHHNYNLFSNLGFGVDLYLDYDYTEKLNLYLELNDLGFIFWKENQYVSSGTLYFDGLDFALDQILETEYNNFADTIIDVFQLEKNSMNQLRVLPLDINLGVSYLLNDDVSELNINYSVQKLYNSFLHTAKLSYLRYIEQYDLTVIPSYSINKYSYSNFSFAIHKRWKNRFLTNLYVTNLPNFMYGHESNRMNLLGFGSEFYILF